MRGPLSPRGSTDIDFIDSLESLACGDNMDNDGDGFVDYPEDPGCTSPTDNSEVDDCPSGPGCAQCANDLDDDGDDLIDYPSDPGCAAASDSSELDP